MKKLLSIAIILTFIQVPLFSQSTVTTVKLPNGRHVKLLDNKTWEYTSAPTKEASVNYFSSPEPTKRTTTSSSKSSSASSSTSGICGAKTKKTIETYLHLKKEKLRKEADKLKSIF